MRPFFFLVLAFMVIGADQVSKWYVMEHVLRPQFNGMQTGQLEIVPPGFVEWYKAPPERLAPAEVGVLPVFNVVSVWNKGISFGMFNRASAHGPTILIGLASGIALIFLIWLFRNPDKIQSLGIAMVIGGALGNMIDRLRFGAVFDFLDFHAFDYHWPAFNIADSGVVLGVAVLVLHSFLFEKKYQG